MANTLSISALDTLFFRESRPFDAVGGSELASVFPPPPRALAGAVKARIAEALGVDWAAFHKDPDGYEIGGHCLKDLIGDGQDPGVLRLRGPWPCLAGERLYPAPLYLLAADQFKRLARLQIGKAAKTHLGTVRLPTLPGGERGLKPLDDHWLTADGLAQVLSGACPAPDQIHHSAELFSAEPRLGIGRNNQTRTAQEGLLYQTRHLRPVPEMHLELDIDGLPEGLPAFDGLVRLGGLSRSEVDIEVLGEGRPGLLGFGVGMLTLRLRGIFFSIATIAVAIILETVVVNWAYVGGAKGLPILRPTETPFFASHWLTASTLSIRK